MASNNDLLNSLDEMARLEKAIWKSFKKAESESFINPWNFRKQLEVRKSLPGTTPWFWRNYPFWPILALISAFIVIFANPTTISFGTLSYIPYMAFILLGVVSRDKFIKAYSQLQLKQKNFTDHAFGIDNLSLRIFDTLNFHKKSGEKLTKNDIASLIKIVKASQDYQSMSFGYYDYLRKTIIGLIVSSPVTGSYFLYTHRKEVPQYLIKLDDYASLHHWFSAGPIIISLILLFAMLGLTYTLVFHEPKIDMQKKRYLLILNILHESWR